MSVLVSVCVCSTSLAQNRNSVLRSLESVFWLESTSPSFGDKTIREEKMTSVNGSNKWLYWLECFPGCLLCNELMLNDCFFISLAQYIKYCKISEEFVDFRISILCACDYGLHLFFRFRTE